MVPSEANEKSWGLIDWQAQSLISPVVPGA
jgi:hypothetical protein